MQRILLTYALSDGPRVRIRGRWASTSNAIKWAIGLGAVVAVARVCKPGELSNLKDPA